MSNSALFGDDAVLADFLSYSIASGCPPHYSDRTHAAEQANWLISLPRPLPGDYRLAATFEYEELSRKSCKRCRFSCCQILCKTP